MYTDRNFPTKKALKEAVARGDIVTVYQPGGIFPTPTDGTAFVEGPHGVHKWYAQVLLNNGRVINVK